VVTDLSALSASVTIQNLMPLLVGDFIRLDIVCIHDTAIAAHMPPQRGANVLLGHLPQGVRCDDDSPEWSEGRGRNRARLWRFGSGNCRAI